MTGGGSIHDAYWRLQWVIGLAGKGAARELTEASRGLVPGLKR